MNTLKKRPIDARTSIGQFNSKVPSRGRLQGYNPSEHSTQGWVIFYDQMTVSSRLTLRKQVLALTLRILTMASPPFERDMPTTLEFPILLHVNYNICSYFWSNINQNM